MLILKCVLYILVVVVGGQDSIGLCCLLYLVVQVLFLCFKCGCGGIVVLLVNKFGQVSLIIVQYVWDEFGDVVFVFEGDGVDVGIELIIIDFLWLDQGIGFVLLCLGVIMFEDIECVIGEVFVLLDVVVLCVFGMLKVYYVLCMLLYLVLVVDMFVCLVVLFVDKCIVWFGVFVVLCDGCDQCVVFVIFVVYVNVFYVLLCEFDCGVYDVIWVEILVDMFVWVVVNDCLCCVVVVFEMDF